MFLDLDFFKNKKAGETDSFLIDLKFNWALDLVFEKFGMDLGVEKVLKDRFENDEYKKLKA